MANFTLSRQLRLFLQIENGFRYPLLGERLPVSISANTGYSQSLRIFPQDGYNFFNSKEVERLMWIANSLRLDLWIYSDFKNPVIEISEFFG